MRVSLLTNRTLENLLKIFFTYLLNTPVTQAWAVKKIDQWSNSKGIHYYISAEVQEELAKVTKGELCGYCKWCIKPGESHELCKTVLKLESMNNTELLNTWNALEYYDPKALYNQEAGITMETWADAVYSEVSKRRLNWEQYEQYVGLIA